MQPGMMAGYRWERQKGRLSERAEPGVQQLPQEGFLEEAGWPKTDERIEMAEEAERNGKGMGQASLHWRPLEVGRHLHGGPALGDPRLSVGGV